MSGLRWSAGVRLASQAFTWAVTLIVVRLLSPADYGLLAMAMIFVGFLTMVAEFGLGPAVVQKEEVEDHELRKAFGLILTIHASLFLLLFLAAPLISSFFAEPRLVLLIRVLSALFLISAFQVMPDALLQRRMEFRRRSLNDFGGAMLGSVTTLLGALAGWGVWALVAGSFMTQCWKSIGLNRIAPYLHWPIFNFRGVRELLVFGGHFSVTQILWFLFTQADIFIGGKFLGKELLGFYSVAVHLASLPNQRISGIINQVAFPAFSRMQNDLARISSSLLAGARLLSFFSFPILWGISSVAPEIVYLILGPKWIPATLPLQVLSIVMPLRMMSNFVPNAVQGMGRADVVMKNVLFAVVVAPLASLVGVQWGVIGLAMAWLVWAPLVFLQSMYRSLPVVGVRFGELARAMWPSAAAAAVMYAAVAGLRSMMVADEPRWLHLAALVFAGAMSYAAASFVLNLGGVREVRKLIRNLFVTKNALPSRD
jgi:teichuronic acid exporter